MPTAKEIKLQRARQQKQQNTKHEQQNLIQQLTVDFGLLPPSLANYAELSEWIRLKHNFLSSVKAGRENAMIANNKRIEQITEQIRTEVTQELDNINNRRESAEEEQKDKLDVEQTIYDEECKRIEEKHLYLIDSNRIIHEEAKEKLGDILRQLDDKNRELRDVNCKLANHRSKNDEIRAKVLNDMKKRRQAKQDRILLLKRLDTQRSDLVKKINGLQKQIDMYMDYRRHINIDYYNWLDDIKELKTIIDNMDTSQETNHINKLEILYNKLDNLQKNDRRQYSDERYKELDNNKRKWQDEIDGYNRHLDRLNKEFNSVNEVCVEAYLSSALNINNGGQYKTQLETLKVTQNNEYQHLKRLRNTLCETIKTLEMEKAVYQDEVNTSLCILEEETNGLGEKLQNQLDRCNARWDKVQKRILAILDEKLCNIDNEKNAIKEKHNILLAEQSRIEKDNCKLGNGDDTCELSNTKIRLALEYLDKLQKLI